MGGAQLLGLHHVSVEAVVANRRIFFGLMLSPASRRGRVLRSPVRFLRGCDHAAALRPAGLLFLQAEVRRWESMQAPVETLRDPAAQTKSFAME
jgi:hypothetical protein